jgi:putative DNA primase/helicase
MAYTYSNSPDYANSAQELEHLKSALANQMLQLCQMLGYENPKRDGNGYRFGNRGSLAIGSDGAWFDHEAGTGGGPIDLIMHTHQSDFATALKWAKDWTGLNRDLSQVSRPKPTVKPSVDHKKTSEWAIQIWEQSQPIKGTLAEKYLAGRSIHGEFSPDVLRFHPDLSWRDGSNRGASPAFIALLRDVGSGKAKAIQRRFLSANGGKHPKVSHWRSLGPQRGCAVMLSRFGEVQSGTLHICEGIEDALSAKALGYSPVWAVVGTSGISKFPVLPDISRLIVLADNDTKSRAGLRAAEEVIDRYLKTGIVAGYRMPPCKDINELAQNLEAGQ